MECPGPDIYYDLRYDRLNNTGLAVLQLQQSSRGAAGV